MDAKLLRDLEILTDLMEQGGWKSLRVASDNVTVNLGRAPAAPFCVRAGVSGEATRPEEHPVPSQVQEDLPASSGDIDPDWVAVKAPNLGTFYRSPKPGSPPFVQVGQKVESGTELCLIEVMKLFTSVRADQGGTIRHIAAADAELVEGGQPLMYIETD